MSGWVILPCRISWKLGTRFRVLRARLSIEGESAAGKLQYLRSRGQEIDEGRERGMEKNGERSRADKKERSQVGGCIAGRENET